MKTPIELAMRYKKDTSCGINPISCSARLGRMGDVILDGFDLDDDWKEAVNVAGEVYFPDMDYVKWLEEQVLKTLNP